MERISDRQLEIALRFALQDCFEEEIAEMEAIDPSDYPVSEKTKRRFNHALNKAMRQETWNLTIPRPLKKAAVVVLIVATVLFTAMIATPTVRAAVWDVIVKWYDQYIGVRFNPEVETPTTIQEILLPDNLPDGWVFERILEGVYEIESIIISPEGDEYYISQYVIGNDEYWQDNTSIEIQNVEIALGVEGKLFYNDNMVSLYWMDKYLFVVSGEEKNTERVIELSHNMTTAP